LREAAWLTIMRAWLNGASTGRPGSILLSFLSNIFGRNTDRDRLAPLYEAVVRAARDPAWYRDGQVPDTVDGRFDMVAAVLALVLLRLEAEGARSRDETVLLTEHFIDDMEASLRQLGTGDMLVGKNVGKLVGALGGRLGAFRTAIDEGGDFAPIVTRNIFHEAPPTPEATQFVAARLRAFHDRLQVTPSERILAGELS
jgi:cytochrome b pre-mRNA-processing protein 3